MAANSEKNARRYSTKQKVRAVARLEVGESALSICQDIGCAPKVLRKWRNKIVEMHPDKFPNLSGQLDPEVMGQMAEQEVASLEAKMVETADLVIDRIAQLVPETANIKDLFIGYGILSDKIAVSKGKPTSISGEALVVPDEANPAQLESLVEDLRNRRLQQPAREPDRQQGALNA